MRHSFLHRVIALLVIGVSGLTLSGCGKSDGIDGKVYHQASGGPITIEFKNGKAKVEIGGETKTLDYKVDGDTITIVNKTEGDLVLTKHSDGTITSPLGEMVAK